MIRKNFILLLLLNLAGVLFAQLTISPTASPSIPEGSNINLGDYFSVSGGTPTGWTLDGKSITFTNVSLSYKDNGKLLQCKDAPFLGQKRPKMNQNRTKIIQCI